MTERSKTPWRVAGTMSIVCAVAVLAFGEPGLAQTDAEAVPSAVANGPSAIVEVEESHAQVPESAVPEAEGDASEAAPESVMQDDSGEVSAPSVAVPVELKANETKAIESQPLIMAPIERTPIMGEHDEVRSTSAAWGTARTVGALAFVVGLILVLRRGMKWWAVRTPSIGSQLAAGGRAPSGVVEVLARYPIMRGQKLVLLRLDRRILLLNQTSSGFSTLCELTDAEEVAGLLTKISQNDGASSSARFKAVMRDVERDPMTTAGDGEVEIVTVAAAERALRTPRLAMHDQVPPASMMEPKPSTTGADALLDRLRSLRERWA